MSDEKLVELRDARDGIDQAFIEDGSPEENAINDISVEDAIAQIIIEIRHLRHRVSTLERKLP